MVPQWSKNLTLWHRSLWILLIFSQTLLNSPRIQKLRFVRTDCKRTILDPPICSTAVVHNHGSVAWISVMNSDYSSVDYSHPYPYTARYKYWLHHFMILLFCKRVALRIRLVFQITHKKTKALFPIFGLHGGCSISGASWQSHRSQIRIWGRYCHGSSWLLHRGNPNLSPFPTTFTINIIDLSIVLLMCNKLFFTYIAPSVLRSMCINNFE